MKTQTILKLATMTEMNYCHRDHCQCGGDSDGTYPNLLYTNVAGGNPVPDWLPGWVNGVEPEDLYEWIQEQSWHNAAIRDALKRVGLNQYQRFQ